jgi:hypothetical protein
VATTAAPERGTPHHDVDPNHSDVMEGSMDFSTLLSVIDDILPATAIAKFDRDREAFLSLVGDDVGALSAQLLDGVDYGPDRRRQISDRDTPVKKQDTPQCSAYAVVAAMENLWGAHANLSEASLWSQYHTYSAELAVECANTHWVSTANGDGQSLEIGAYKQLEDDFRGLMAAIDAAHPCVAAISVPKAMMAGAAQVEDGSPMIKHGVFSKSYAGHAVEVAGYKVESGRPYFFIKNSWGPETGTAGYQWLSFHQFKTTPGGYAWFWEIENVRQRA